MAGFDDDDFSLSGLIQEGHKFDVTVISSSSDDDNYDGLLDCARKLAGEISDKQQLQWKVSSQVHRISQFLKQLICCQSFQTPWHLLHHIQSNQFM